MTHLFRALPVIFALGISLPAQADTLFNFSGTDSTTGYSYSGSADFTTQTDGGGYDLVIILSNLASTGPMSTADLLSGLYFDITPDTGTVGALGMLSATATDGLITSTTTTTSSATSVCATGAGGTALAKTCSSTVAGGWEAGYWAGGVSSVNSTLTGVTSHYGVGSTGQGGLFSGNTGNVGQANYSIAPAIGLSSSANSGVTSNFPYVSNQATFLLYGLSTNHITISNVYGAYGTAPEGVPGGTTQAPTAPEPGTFAELAGGGLLISMMARLRKFRRP